MVTTFCGQEHLPLKWGIFPQNPLKCVGSKTLEMRLPDSRHVGSNPTFSATSEQALYRLLRFLYENRGALMPLLLLFRKKPRSALLSFVNALTTPRSLYQLSTSCEGSSPISEKPKNSFHVSFTKSPVAMWFCWACLYFHGRTTDTKTK